MSTTATKILDTAQELTQKRGFNAFSYADIANKIGIRKASIHYHFPSKADLGVRLIERYRKTFWGKLAEIDSAKSNAFEKLKSYIELYQDTLFDDRMCLCGMLASDISTMPEGVRLLVKEFFRDNENWLVGVLHQGRTEGSFEFAGNEDAMSQFILSSVQGALLVSRATGSESKFATIMSELLNSLLTQK